MENENKNNKVETIPIKEIVDVSKIEPINVFSLPPNLLGLSKEYSVICLGLFEDRKLETIDCNQLYKDVQEQSRIKYDYLRLYELKNENNSQDIYLDVAFKTDKVLNNDIIDGLLETFAPYNPYEEQEIIKRDNNKPVKQFILNHTKLFNEPLFVSESKKYSVVVSKKNQPKRHVYITINSDEKYLEQYFLDSFDRIVYEHICSFFHEGYEWFSLAQLGEVIYKKPSSKLSDKQRKKMKKSIDKMRVQLVSLDFTEQVRNKETGTVYKETYLLNVDFEKRKAKNNRIVDGYVFNKIPVLLQYAYDIKQFTCIPAKVRNALAGKFSMTDRNLDIIRYLETRISRMKNNKTKSANRIRFDAIYKGVVENPKKLNREQTKRIRETVFATLDTYKETNFIKEYTKYNNNEPNFIGVEIKP